MTGMLASSLHYAVTSPFSGPHAHMIGEEHHGNGHHGEGGAHSYGAIYDQKPPRSRSGGDRAPLNLGSLIGCVVAPLLVFVAVCYVRSMQIRYESNVMSMAICLIILLLVFLFCCTPSFDFSSSKSRQFTFMLFSCTLAWLLGVGYGDYNFDAHFKPFYDVSNLNVYPSVDPSTYTGNQLMDAGQIEFNVGSHVALNMSYGFKNEDVYCVAPIVGPKQNATKGIPNYDFWAIGLNCCSGHVADFHCGEYASTKARKGLRLMRDDLRGYFRLAVQEAEASYNIQATHPIFVYWMEFPSDEIRSYNEEGWSSFLSGLFGFLGLQIALTAVAAVYFI